MVYQETRPLIRLTAVLAQRLDGLPLAIVIAAAFMRQTGTSITYAERQYTQGNILQTWMISYNEIQKRDPNATNLLLLLARFDNRDIWYELVENASHSSDIPDWLKRVISSRLAFKLSVKPLMEFSLLEIKQQEGSYAMHPVVQDWCFYVASGDINYNSVKLSELGLICVGYSVPGVDNGNYVELQQQLIPHANAVRIGQISADDIAIWGGLYGLGNLYSDQGKLREAEEMYQRALAGYEKAVGPDHTSTLNTVNSLGNLYFHQGKLKEAEEMYQRALTGFEKALGPDHISTLNTVNNLGSLYSDQGKLKEAEEMFQRALTGKEKALGPDHTSTLNTVHNLGILYFNQGKLKEAEEMYQRALTGKEKALGPDHTSTLDTVNNLGSLYKDQGKLKDAEKMYQRALAGKEKALGPDHTSTLDTVNNLGRLYSDQGKLKDPEDLWQGGSLDSQDVAKLNANKGRRAMEKIKRWLR
ncbi:uncharacterized protein N7483_010131 [Penicillium malachiteum]|uniref:uncharacterized protein n=1 Tax=Penicillium malachiteum TaxID=1324776 RepID=UPI00254748E7|nr:uncharacterized protein N7483_010131 [Penicillium malachiteum]KAJ5712950.1 hypothetical protein N7483_010131 [Penicillium malachiteum]